MAKQPPPKGKTKKATKPALTTTEWMVDVKAESSMDDISKLFLEAQAVWQPPVKWDAKATAKAVSGVGIVSRYLKERFISFLTYESPEKGN